MADLTIEAGSRKVSRAGKTIPLTAKEYSLHEFLAQRAGQKVTRAQISRQVWDDSHDAYSNLIEIYLGRLRRKIDSGRVTPVRHAVRGEATALRRRRPRRVETGVHFCGQAAQGTIRL